MKEKRSCLNCQHLAPTTDDEFKVCGCWLNKGNSFYGSVSIVHRKLHVCEYYTGNDGVSAVGLKFSDEN